MKQVNNFFLKFIHIWFTGRASKYITSWIIKESYHNRGKLALAYEFGQLLHEIYEEFVCIYGQLDKNDQANVSFWWNILASFGNPGRNLYW